MVVFLHFAVASLRASERAMGRAVVVRLAGWFGGLGGRVVEIDGIVGRYRRGGGRICGMDIGI